MYIKEIIELPARDEYIDKFLPKFVNAAFIAKVNGIDLRRAIDEFNDIHYGLFDNDILIGYFYLEKKDRYYQVRMISVSTEYRGQGYATYLMDYAVIKDNLIIASDTHQTPDAKALWMAVLRNKRYNVYKYDLSTGVKVPVQKIDGVITPDPWNQKDDTILITEVFGKEHMRRLQENEDARIKGGRTIVLYGPGTSSETFWNP